jgi:predicted heme/steroid binding protein
VNDVYDDDSGKGTYTWHNGEQYVRQWKNGEHQGKCIFSAGDDLSC